jgi:hypothetical protein
VNYAFYAGYHLMFLVSAVCGIYRSRLSLLAFVAGCVLLALLTDGVLPAADLNWYRTVYDDLSLDTFLLFAIQNDFEVLWAAAVLATKALVPEGVATVGLTSLLLLLFPLCWRKVREHVGVLSLLMIFPGSFLIFLNTMRQGFSEYLVLAGMLSASLLLQFLSGTMHRFGYVVALLSWLSRWIPPWLMLAPAAVFGLLFWRLLAIISPENDMQAIYAQLHANYLSFGLKVLLYSLPYLVARLSRYFERTESLQAGSAAADAWRVGSNAFLSIAGLTLVSVLVNPRLADRISFYILPVSLWALSRSGISKTSRTLFCAIVFALGLNSLFLGSHREFFDPTVVVTEQLEHGEAAEGE